MSAFIEWLKQDMHIVWAMLSVGVTGLILSRPGGGTGGDK